MRQLLLVALALLGLATQALAHSALERTEPKDGAQLRQSPNEVRMWFAEPIKVQLSTVTVSDAAGKQIDQRDLHADEQEPTQVRLSLPKDLAPGVYRVTWSAIAPDLHVGKGTFSFQIAR